MAALSRRYIGGGGIGGAGVRRWGAIGAMLFCAGLEAGQALAGQAPANPPATAPANPAATAPAGQSGGKKPGATSSNALPTADEVLAHYIRALGGEQVLRKFTSRVMKGTFE